MSKARTSHRRHCLFPTRWLFERIDVGSHMSFLALAIRCLPGVSEREQLWLRHECQRQGRTLLRCVARPCRRSDQLVVVHDLLSGTGVMKLKNGGGSVPLNSSLDQIG